MKSIRSIFTRWSGAVAGMAAVACLAAAPSAFANALVFSVGFQGPAMQIGHAPVYVQQQAPVVVHRQPYSTHPHGLAQIHSAPVHVYPAPVVVQAPPVVHYAPPPHWRARHHHHHHGQGYRPESWYRY